jgi:hypothetical protein
MFLRKYLILIVISFLSIFSAKMIISAAPVFICHIDKATIKSVIMQLEQEHSEGDSSKDLLKFSEFKVLHLPYQDIYIPLIQSFGISNSFIDHFKRYVDPYHPSVPTPPPNIC